MPAHVRVSGSWNTVSSMFTRVGGSWKSVVEGYTRISGAWRPFFTSVTPLTIEYLVIAGGGAGGSNIGGGGGAGGYRTATGFVGALATSYTVTVGAGGARQGEQLRGLSGANSVFSTITSTGGGGGSGNQSGQTAFSGGSGGGGSFGNTTAASGNSGGFSPSEGNSGGNGNSAVFGSGGGGGGASAAGTAGSNTANQGSQGGNGTASSITGTSVTRAGGGGGGRTQSGTSSAAIGGTGGGGNGGFGTSPNAQTDPTEGSANTGSGGGGAGWGSGELGANGGSGVVILRYSNAYAISVGAGLSFTTTSSGGFSVTTFTAGTGNVSFNQAIVSDYELIGTFEVGASGAASVTFSGLDQYSSSFRHLQIRGVARTTRAQPDSPLGIQLNGDASSNYALHLLEGNGSNVISAALTSQTTGFIGSVNGSTAAANSFGAVVTDILDFASSAKRTTIRSLAGQHSGVPYVYLTSTLWNNTNAVTSITLNERTGASFVSGSRFSIYGIKG